MDIFEDYYDPSKALSGVNKEQGKELSDLVKQVQRLDKDIEAQEEKLKALKHQKNKITHDLMPDMMSDMGIEKLEVDGCIVSTKEIVSGQIPVGNKDLCFEWLRENNLEDVIKNEVAVAFSKGQDNSATELRHMLDGLGMNYTSKTYIHPSTYKAFIRECVTKGIGIDLNLFGAYISSVAQVKRKV